MQTTWPNAVNNCVVVLLAAVLLRVFGLILENGAPNFASQLNNVNIILLFASDLVSKIF